MGGERGRDTSVLVRFARATYRWLRARPIDYRTYQEARFSVVFLLPNWVLCLVAVFAVMLLGSCTGPAKAERLASDDLANCAAVCAPRDWSYAFTSTASGCTCFGYAAHDAGGAK